MMTLNQIIIVQLEHYNFILALELNVGTLGSVILLIFFH